MNSVNEVINFFEAFPPIDKEYFMYVEELPPLHSRP
jgi:hypothetical protein